MSLFEHGSAHAYTYVFYIIYGKYLVYIYTLIKGVTRNHLILETSWCVSSLPPGWHSRFPNGYRLPSDRLPFILQTSAFWNSCGPQDVQCSGRRQTSCPNTIDTHCLATFVTSPHNPNHHKSYHDYNKLPRHFQLYETYWNILPCNGCLLRLVRLSVAKPVTLAARKCNSAKRKPEFNRMKFRRGLSRRCKA